MIRHLIKLPLAFALALAVTACSTSPSTTVTSLVVAGPTLAAGASGQYTATATFADGTTLNVSNSSTWSSSNNAVATVSASGLVTGISDGSATITATYTGVAGTAIAQIIS